MGRWLDVGVRKGEDGSKVTPRLQGSWVAGGEQLGGRVSWEEPL